MGDLHGTTRCTQDITHADVGRCSRQQEATARTALANHQLGSLEVLEDLLQKT
jgi:hypothetical protein